MLLPSPVHDQSPRNGFAPADDHDNEQENSQLLILVFMSLILAFLVNSMQYTSGSFAPSRWLHNNNDSFDLKTLFSAYESQANFLNAYDLEVYKSQLRSAQKNQALANEATIEPDSSFLVNADLQSISNKSGDDRNKIEGISRDGHGEVEGQDRVTDNEKSMRGDSKVSVQSETVASRGVNVRRQ